MILRTWLFLLWSVAAVAAEDFHVETARRGGAVEVRAYPAAAGAVGWIRGQVTELAVLAVST